LGQSTTDSRRNVPQSDSTRDWGGPPLGAIREAASELIAIAEERFPDKFSEIVSKGHVETSERQNRRTAGLGLEDRDDVLPGRELRLWGRLPGRTHLLDLAQQADGHGAAACGGHSLSVLHQLLLGTLLEVLGMVVKETGEVFCSARACRPPTTSFRLGPMPGPSRGRRLAVDRRGL